MAATPARSGVDATEPRNSIDGLTAMEYRMTPLLAESFLNDPRIAEARRLILTALSEHQQELTGVRPPREERAETYRQTIERFEQMRGGGLFYPYLGSGFGKGPLVELADGSVKYDMICGIGVHGFGHMHELLVDAALDAALRDTVMQGNLQQNTESMKLTRTLIDAACRRGASLEHCFLSTSGAMANENALKMLFQRHAPADRLLAFDRCFAGRTIAISAITDRPGYRAGLPQTLLVDYVPFYDAASGDESIERSLAALRSHIQRYPGRHAAMIFELVQGEGGYYPGTRPFFAALMDELRQHKIGIFIDEIQTFARTTEPFAFQHFQLDEYVDVATVGKITQVCATLFRADYKPKPGLISQTFTGATSSIFASRAMIETLLAGDWFGANGRIMRLHDRVVRRLDALAHKHPDRIHGPYGLGGMIAFTPFDGSRDRVKAFLTALFDAGVIAFSTGGSTGTPHRVRLLLPIGAMTDADADAVAKIIEQTLEKLA